MKVTSLMANPENAACPSRQACEACGAVTTLSVVIFDLPIGALCATLCGSCARDGALPLWLRSGGAGRVSRHEGHIERSAGWRPTIDSSHMATTEPIRSAHGNRDLGRILAPGTSSSVDQCGSGHPSLVNSVRDRAQCMRGGGSLEQHQELVDEEVRGGVRGLLGDFRHALPQ